MLWTENMPCLLLQGWFWFREFWGSLDWEILILDEICLIIEKGSDCQLICNGKVCQI